MRRLLPALALVAALAAYAGARAGGGQSYTGSSGYSGSSYSGSSSSSSYSYSRGPESDLVDLYIAFVVLHPLVGVPFTLFILYMIIVINNSRSTGVQPLTGDTMIRGGGQTASRKAVELGRLRERDPAFDERAFLQRAAAAFMKIQEAWSAGDMTSARAFISDGVNERFGRQLAGLAARGRRNLMEGVEIRGIETMACRSDKHFDAICVRIAALASDRTVDAGGSTLSGSSGRTPFEEVWTFLRRPGAKTLKTPGIIEGQCPSCGSPLPIADAARCGACKAWVNSGEYDWVLTEITQSCEWTLREPGRDVDGWAEASAADPALSLPALEDRASVIFWRWLDARRANDPAPLRAVAAEAFCSAFASEPAELDDAAVGGAEVVAFEDAGAWSRVHVGVKWSAGRELRRDFFVLSRARGAKTDARGGLRTARCAACGAPSADASVAACAYCGAALNDGKKDWILTGIIPFGEWTRPSAATLIRVRADPRPAAPAAAGWGEEMSPSDAYAVLAMSMLADGEESLAEKAFLEAYAQARGLPAERAAEISAAARAGKLAAPRPADGAQAESMLRGMIRMSLADGVVTDAERAALHSFGARFALRPVDIAAMVLEERDGKG